MPDVLDQLIAEPSATAAPAGDVLDHLIAEPSPAPVAPPAPMVRPPMVNPATPAMVDWFRQQQDQPPAPMTAPELDQMTGRAAQQYAQSQFFAGQQQRVTQQEAALRQAQEDATRAQANLANAPTPGDYGALPQYTEPVAQANARATMGQAQLDATRAEQPPAAPNAIDNFTVAERRVKAAIAAGTMGPDALDKLKLARDLSDSNLVQLSPAQAMLLPVELKAKMRDGSVRMNGVQPGGAYDIGGHTFVSKQVYDQFIGDGGGPPLPPVDPGWLRSKANALTAGIIDLGPKAYQAVQGARATIARTGQAIASLPAAVRNAQGDSGAQPPPISKAMGDVAQAAESDVGQSIRDFRQFQQKNLPTRGDFGDQLIGGLPGMAMDVGAAAAGGPGAFAMSMAARTASETYANAIAENPQDHGAAMGKAMGAGVYTAMVARLTPQVGEGPARTLAARIANGFAANAPQMIAQSAGVEAIQNLGTGKSLDWQAIMANAVGTAATFAVAHGLLGHGGGADPQSPRGVSDSKTPVNPAGAIETGGAETNPRAPTQEAQGDRPVTPSPEAGVPQDPQAQGRPPVDQTGGVAATAAGPAPVEQGRAPVEADPVAGGAAAVNPPADSSDRTPEAPVEQRGDQPPTPGGVSTEQPREQLPQPQQGEEHGAGQDVADQVGGEAVGAHGDGVPQIAEPTQTSAPQDATAPPPSFADRVQSIVNRVARQRGPGGEGVSNLGDKVTIAAAHKAYEEQYGPMPLPEFKRSLIDNMRAGESRTGLALVREDLPKPELAASATRVGGKGGTDYHYVRTDPSYRGPVHGYGGEPATEPESAKPARDLAQTPVPRGKIGEAILGKGSFIGGDVVPTAKAGAGAVLEGARQLRGLLAPQTAGEQARQMQGIAREHGAELAQRGDRAADALREARKAFASKKPAENYDFIAKMEGGEPQSDPKLTAAASQIRQLLDGRRREVQSLGKGKLEHFIQDYFPHIWEDPEAAAKTFAQILAKRPLEGSKGFLKKRTIDTFSEGIAAGLKPISDNPVDLVLLKLREMDRYILGQKMLAEMKGKGLAKFVRATDRAPEGMTKIDDKIAQVYGPPTVKVEEHVDQAQFDALDQTLKNLGIAHDRVASIGRGAGGGKVLGRSFGGQDRIESRIGSDLSVIAHELGHQIDERYDLGRQLTGIIGGDTSTVTPATGGRFRVAAPKAEYDALTNLRFGDTKPPAAFKAYNFKPAEQLAQVVEAYVHAPERMREVAPTLYRWFNDFVESHHELTPLRDVRPSLQMKSLQGEVPHGGLLKMGEYYAPDQVANVLNNYLSPGLRQKSGLFRGYLGAANVMNQAQLGFSAFHLGFTSMDAMTSKLALGIEQAVEGKPVDALKSLAATPTAPFTNLLKGSKLLREWVKPGSEGADVAQLVDGLKAAGGRVKQDSFYQTNMSRKMVDAFKSGNILGGLLRVPAGLADAVAKPIMEYVVPRQKLGIFADLARKEMEKLGPNASRDELRAAMGKAWDSVDNRMGQVVYDNLFWNKAVKDIGMASVRSLGWNLGTFRELGGGAIDTLKAGAKLATFKKPEFTHRMAYALAMPALAATVGGVMHYMMTGKKPEDMKDYFFPKTGEQDENGHDVRVSLPTYMKDVYAYGHAPLQTLSHKAHPIVSATIQMLQNRDYYGTKIRNEDDPAMKQAMDLLKHAGKQFVPLGILGYLKMAEEGAPPSKQALPFVGITQAPGSISRSKAEETASELLAQRMPQGSRTHVEADRTKMKSDLAKQFKTDREGTLAKMRDAIQSGQLDKEDMRAIVKRSGETGLEAQVGHLDLDDAIKVWGDATPQERETLRTEMLKKVVAAKRVQPSQKPDLIRAIREGRDAKLAG